MRPASLFLAATAFTIACSGDGTGPQPGGNDDGARLAAGFDRLADSVEAGGYSPTGEALRHAAEIVRLTGHATEVNLTVDGSVRRFLAVAEQIDFPNLVCTWPADSGVAPPPDSTGGPPPDSVGPPPPDSGFPFPDSTPTPPDSVGLPPIDSGVVPPDSGPPTPVDSGVVQPPGPPECHAEGTFSMRTVIAWEPEHLDEVVRIVGYSGGPNTGDVPVVMNGLPVGSSANPGPPTGTPPDSGGGSGGGTGGFPGFLGEYLVRDVGSWYAVSGSETNDLLTSGGKCTSDQATFDWAEFGCESARFRSEFSMQVDPLRYEPVTGAVDPPGGPEGQHDLAMPLSEVEGVRLTWHSWTMPPPPVEGGKAGSR
jgi:hypothetical protein